MSPERWQRLVGQELLENLGKGTWGDYVVPLMRRHDLTKKWREAGWNNKRGQGWWRQLSEKRDTKAGEER